MPEPVLRDINERADRAPPTVDAVLADLLDEWRAHKREWRATSDAGPRTDASSGSARTASRAKPDPEDDDRVGQLESRLAITEAALKAERQRLKEMRADLDELEALKAAFVEQRGHADELRADRDRWATRAEALALALFREARAARSVSEQHDD